MLDCFIKYVLLGWENVKDESGKDYPYTEENARKLMTALPELYADLLTQANDFSNFRAAEVQEMAKNSESSSAGK